MGFSNSIERAEDLVPVPVTRAGALGRAFSAVAANRVARALWRYRASVFGLLAALLALYGEQLMRTPIGGPASNPALGARLTQIAALLVGIVSWVRDGFFARPQPLAQSPGSTDGTPGPLAARRATAPARTPARPVPTSAWGRARRFAQGYAARRARAGWAGVAIGLLVVVNLGIWCYILLARNISDPLAPWVWLAMLAALALTFVSVRPRPAAGGLLAHDPAEPAQEPPVSRAEWLVLGVILLAALALRVWNLENIPVGPYIDESDRAIVARHFNRGEATEFGPFSFFGADWWGVPSAYFWLVGQSLKVFGDTLAGARMVHALAGVLTIWFTYRLGRAVWSPRAGLFAAALLTVSDFAIQFSRTAGESTITMLTWTVCFYYLYRGLKSARLLDFVLAGVAGGLTLYGYASGKLLPPVLLLVAIYLLARWGLTGARRYLPGLALMALAAGLTFAPSGLYMLAHPDTFTTRYKGVSIFNHQNEIFAAERTNSWVTVIGHQVELTFGAFDTGTERGPFYPTRMPILPVPWAALWVLGTAYAVWRLGDARYALLCAWLLGGLAGAVLTNETPSLQRVAAMVPLLALIPALYADRVVGDLPARVRVRARWRARVLRAATSAALAALAILVGLQTVPYYFGPYNAEAHYYDYTLAGRYAQGLDPKKDVLYQSGIPALLGSPSPTVFLAGDLPLRDLTSPGDNLPLINNDGRNAHMLFFPSDDPLISLIQSLYPGSTSSRLSKSGGGAFLTALRLSSQQIDAQRVASARYGPPNGPIYERKEARLGTVTGAGTVESETVSSPVWMTYPLQAEWTGGLLVPVYGNYKLNLIAPGGASLDIDGRGVLTATGESPSNTRVVLARGVHQVHLSGTLPGPDGRVELRWGTDAGLPVPIARQFLWNGPPGVLTGTFYLETNIPGFVTTPQPAYGHAVPALERRDGVLSWHDLNGYLNSGDTLIAAWKGKLLTPTAGEYRFDADTDSVVTIWIDGYIIGGHRAGAGTPELPLSVRLTAGEHDFEVRYKAVRQDDHLLVYWQPPNQPAPAVLSAQAFKPREGGVWTPAERPEAPSVSPQAIASGGAAQVVKINKVITGAMQSTRDARGVVVLPDGTVVVGDTGNHRLVTLNTAGEQLAAWGTAGKGDGLFDTISDLAASQDGIIAALDANNSDIQMFTSTGTKTLHLTSDQLGIAHASGITWGPDGKIYVADTSTNRVVRFSSLGQEEASYGAGSTDHHALDQPTDVAVTPEGDVYAVDLSGRVVHFGANGTIDREYQMPTSGFRGGSHLAVWGAVLAVTDPDRNNINFLDLKAGVISAIQTLDGTGLGLQVPVGVAVGPDGRLYVLDSANNRVVVLDKVK